MKKKTDSRDLHEGYVGLKEVEVRLVLKEMGTRYSTHAMDSPDAAVEVMRDVIKDCDREKLCVVNLDSALRPINFHVVSVGDATHTIAPIQNLFKSAILSNATRMIIVHNHPAGGPPSPADITVTERVALAGRLMEVALLDHLIISGIDGSIISIRDTHPDIFDDVIDYKVAEKLLEPGMANEEERKYSTRFEIADRVQTLANDIDDFSYNYDTYGYWDAVEDREEAVGQVVHDLMNNDAGHLREWLEDIRQEDEELEIRSQAEGLIRRINEVTDALTADRGRSMEASFPRLPAKEQAVPSGGGKRSVLSRLAENRGKIMAADREPAGSKERGEDR